MLLDSHRPGGDLGLGNFLHEERAEQEGTGLWFPPEELHLRLQPRGVYVRVPGLAHLCHCLHSEGGAYPGDIHSGPDRAQGSVRSNRLQDHHAAIRAAALLPHQLHHRGFKRGDAAPLPELLHEHLPGPAGQLHTSGDAAKERDPHRLPEVHRHLGVFRRPGRAGDLALRADSVRATLPVAVGPLFHGPSGQRTTAGGQVFPGLRLQDAGVGVHVQKHLLLGVQVPGASGAVCSRAGGPEVGRRQQPGPVLPLCVRE